MFCIDNEFKSIFLVLFFYSLNVWIFELFVFVEKHELYMNFDTLVSQSTYVILTVSLVFPKYFDELNLKFAMNSLKCTELVINLT